jgi:type I site-specific restriction-modification system R (restriction) subunit
VFTTIQKFMPEEKGDRHPVLSQRRNIVVIADEAHRSQYDFIDGLARHLHDALPNASFIGFTGTPIEKTDANTRAVFGDYISIYDIQRAVIDGATVPICYESRLAKLELKPSERPKIDPEFEELTEGEEVERKEKLKTKWAQLEAIVGSQNRVKTIAHDLVAHFEERLAAMDGKAMIVCMSRRILLRRARNQRQRSQGIGRADLEDNRPRAGCDRAQQCDDRLDLARERPRAAPRVRQAHPPQVRLSARQAGKGNPDRPGTSGIALRGLGGRLTALEGNI